jgi:hypothetical protein
VTGVLRKDWENGMQTDGWVRYEWSETEVKEAIAYLRELHPKDWEEIKRLELTSGDLTESSAADILMGALLCAYDKNFDRRDVVGLFGYVRAALRADLGLG